MGSFINTLAKFDPIQQFAGKNSFIAKQDSYDPLMKNSSAGQAYAQRHVVGSTPTPYAGVTPTLQDANQGYVQASAQARQKVQQPFGQQNTQQSVYQV